MGRNVFTIPPGVPFLSTFVEALLAGEIVSSVSRASAPIDLARMTIYVPTQRAARALAAEFARAIKAPAALLPRILPLGSLEEQEDIALFSGYAEEFDERFLPAIDEIERRLILARLILKWARALGHAIVSYDPDGAPVVDKRETMLVSPSPANACALAKELGALIDEFIIENVDPSAIDGLAGESFDQYWAITTRFLSIALRQWPLILEQRGMIDRARRQRALLAAQIEHLKSAGEGDPGHRAWIDGLQSDDGPASRRDLAHGARRGGPARSRSRSRRYRLASYRRGFRRTRRAFLHASAIHSKAPFAHHEHRPRGGARNRRPDAAARGAARTGGAGVASRGQHGTVARISREARRDLLQRAGRRQPDRGAGRAPGGFDPGAVHAAGVGDAKPHGGVDHAGSNDRAPRLRRTRAL